MSRGLDQRCVIESDAVTNAFYCEKNYESKPSHKVLVITSEREWASREFGIFFLFFGAMRLQMKPRPSVLLR